MRNNKLSRSTQKNLVLFVILLVLCAFFYSQNNRFITVYNLTNMVRQSLPNFILGCGMTFVIASGAIDLSVGGAMALSAMLYGYLCIWGVSPWLAVVIVAGFGVVVGIFNTIIMEKL